MMIATPLLRQVAVFPCETSTLRATLGMKKRCHRYEGVMTLGAE
jgi:hypothetical protein